MGAGSSVYFGKPTTLQLRNILIKKYENIQIIDENQSQLKPIIEFSCFDDIEHILQCIKDMDDFFNSNSYKNKFLLESDSTFGGPYINSNLQELVERIKTMKKMIEDEVFENYSWDHTADDKLNEIYSNIFNMLKKFSKEIYIFTTNYDKAVEECCSKQERKYRCIDGFRYDEYSNRRIWSGKYNYPSTEDITNVYLYKLHGSLNWKKHKIYGIESTSEERRSVDTNYGSVKLTKNL